uniref:Uncharacterized protein n=1 Tax=viral metagenome TaxID=1070528 RepID=A0A6C0BD41_9ZZZZ
MSINLALPIISRNLAQLEHNYSCANTVMNYVIQELETMSSELLIFNGIPLNIFSDELILTVYNLNERIIRLTNLVNDCKILLAIISQQINEYHRKLFNKC